MIPWKRAALLAAGLLLLGGASVGYVAVTEYGVRYLPVVSAPDNCAAVGRLCTYVKSSDNQLYYKNAGGTEVNLSSGGGTTGGGGMTIGDAVAGGTDQSALFVSAGDLAQDNAHYSYDESTHFLTVYGLNIPGGTLGVDGVDQHAIPSDTSDLMSVNATQTPQFKTLNSTDTLSSVALSGTMTGTYTLGGTPTIAAPTVTGTLVVSELGNHSGSLYGILVPTPSPSPSPSPDTLALLHTPQTFSGAQNVYGYVLTDAATIATDAARGNTFEVTLTGDHTLGNPTNLQFGGNYTWVFIQDPTGAHALAFGSAFNWSGSTAPTISVAANSVDMISCAAYTDHDLLCVWGGGSFGH